MTNPTDKPPAARGPFYGWRLLSALWTLYFLNMGFALYGGAVLSAAMLRQIPMSRATYGLGFTLLNLFAGVPSVAIAAVIHRWGARQSFLIGSGLICAGALWMAFVATEPWHYLFGFGVLIASGIGFSTLMPLSTVVSRWFCRYRGRAMAIALTASGFGGLAAAPLMNQLLTATGGNWRAGWMLVAGLALLSAAIAWLAVKESPAALGQQVDGGGWMGTAATTAPSAALDSTPATTLVTRRLWLPAEAYRTRAFWMICLGSVACQFPFFLFTAHWILHLRGVGFSAANAALAMGLFTLGSIPGGLMGGWLIDRIPARFAFMLGLGCTVAGSVLAIRASAGSLTVALSAALLYGIGFRWSYVCLSTITAHYYGPEAYPRLSGTVLMLSALLCSPAGLVGGKLYDLYGSYNPAFALNIAVATAGICALGYAKRPLA